jgi:hypothetical protein
MRDRQNDSRERPHLKSKPSDNMLHFSEYKVALIRQMIQVAYFFRIKSTSFGNVILATKVKKSARLPNKSKTGIPVVTIDE